MCYEGRSCVFVSLVSPIRVWPLQAIIHARNCGYIAARLQHPLTLVPPSALDPEVSSSQTWLYYSITWGTEE